MEARLNLILPKDCVDSLAGFPYTRAKYRDRQKFLAIPPSLQKTSDFKVRSLIKKHQNLDPE
jgi:hypothetical protein